jgi:hypothetical protein
MKNTISAIIIGLGMLFVLSLDKRSKADYFLGVNNTGICIVMDNPPWDPADNLYVKVVMEDKNGSSLSGGYLTPMAPPQSYWDPINLMGIFPISLGIPPVPPVIFVEGINFYPGPGVSAETITLLGTFDFVSYEVLDTVEIYVIPGDTDGDGNLTLTDFSHFAARWLDNRCDILNDWCSWTDFGMNGNVGMDDLMKFMENWMTGISK